MANLAAVRAQAIVFGDGRYHVYRTYGRSAYEARKRLNAAARTFRMKVDWNTLNYRYDSVNEQIAHPETV